MTEEKTCNHPEEHEQHLCQLKKRLSRSELNDLRKNPKYVCTGCGGRVDRGGNLCLPKRIKT